LFYKKVRRRAAGRRILASDVHMCKWLTQLGRRLQTSG